MLRETAQHKLQAPHFSSRGNGAKLRVALSVA